MEHRSKNCVYLLCLLLMSSMLFGCEPTADSNDENRVPGNRLPAPELQENEVHDLVLNEGVINVDEFSELRNVEVTKSNGCEGDEAVQTGIDDLRFGFPCTLVKMTYDHLNEPTIEEGSLIFSAKHRFMGRVVRMPNKFRLAKDIFIERVDIDTIFAQLRIEANLPTLNPGSLPTEEVQSPLQTIGQPLFIETGREFALNESFSTSFFAFDDNEGTVSGDIAVKGNMALVINVGAFVPEEEKYARVVLNLESVAEATVAMTLKDNFEQATENDATLANIPLLFGWLYADLAFELKGGLEAKIEGQMSNQIVWKSTDRVYSTSTWTPRNGWFTDIQKESEPWDVESQFEASGTASLSAQVGLSTTLSLFKTLGVEVAITPTLEGEAKGSVELSVGNEAPALEAEACLEISGKVELEVNSKVRGFEDQKLYESTLTEHTFYELGECEDDEDEEMDLPIPFEADGVGLQFSCSSSQWSVCSEYRGLEQSFFEFLAQSCIDRGWTLSADPCLAVMGMEGFIGTCDNVRGGRTTYYYADGFHCLPTYIPEHAHPMCNSFSEYPDLEPVWNWSETCLASAAQP